VSHLRSTATGLWRSLFPGRDHPLLHGAYQKVHVECTTREELEATLGPSGAKCYLTRCQGRETVEFITDPGSGKVVAKKYLAGGLGADGGAVGELRFESTLRVVREILASRKRARRVPVGLQFHQPAQPTTLYEWFAGPATEKLLGRGSPGDHYYINGRPIEPRAYRTLLASHDGDDLLVEVRSRW